MLAAHHDHHGLLEAMMACIERAGGRVTGGIAPKGRLERDVQAMLKQIEEHIDKSKS